MADVIRLRKWKPRTSNVNEKGEKFCAGECQTFKPLTEFKYKRPTCDKCYSKKMKKEYAAKKENLFF